CRSAGRLRWRATWRARALPPTAWLRTVTARPTSWRPTAPRTEARRTAVSNWCRWDPDWTETRGRSLAAAPLFPPFLLARCCRRSDISFSGLIDLYVEALVER